MCNKQKSKWRTEACRFGKDLDPFLHHYRNLPKCRKDGRQARVNEAVVSCIYRDYVVTHRQTN